MVGHQLHSPWCPWCHLWYRCRQLVHSSAGNGNECCLHPLRGRHSLGILKVTAPIAIFSCTEILQRSAYMALLTVNIMDGLSWELCTVGLFVKAVKNHRAWSIMKVWWNVALVTSVLWRQLIILHDLLLLAAWEIILNQESDSVWQCCLTFCAWQEAIFEQLVLSLCAIVGVHCYMVVIVTKHSSPVLLN